MAIAPCGMHWSWDSPMWCSGKEIKNNLNKELIDKPCISCPWYKGNKHSE